MSNFFNTGFESVEAEERRQEANRASMGKKLWRLLVKPNEEADIRFLHTDPVCYSEHSIQSNGKWDNMLCTQDGSCPLCAKGEKPSFKGAFLVWDKRVVTYKDKKTGEDKVLEGNLRLYVAGTKVMSQIARLKSKYGSLTKLEFTLCRYGASTATSYTVQRGDSVTPYSSMEIESMLPEKLRADYDGTEDSLLNIIQEQLLMTLPNYTAPTTTEEELPYEDVEEELPDLLGDEQPKGVKNKFKRFKR